jgi:hypothetical protein
MRERLAIRFFLAAIVLINVLNLKAFLKGLFLFYGKRC